MIQKFPVIQYNEYFLTNCIPVILTYKQLLAEKLNFFVRSAKNLSN